MSDAEKAQLNAAGDSPTHQTNENRKYVQFDGPEDSMNPLNWPTKTRILIAVVVAFDNFLVALASSIFAPTIPTLMRKYSESRVVITLGVSLYVLGFATGPVIWASLSELKGRRLPMIISLLGFTIFSFATAVSNNLESVLVTRYFGGFFGSGPLTLAGAIYSDMFAGKSLGIAMVSYAFMVFLGPVLAQPIGGFTVINSSLGWRWTEYICGILGVAAVLVTILIEKETHHPIILARKAADLRKQTNDPSFMARHDEVKTNFRSLVVDFLAMPLRMLASDLVVLLMSLFGSFVYGLLYLFLSAYPIVFQQVHHMSPGVGGLPFLGLIVGQLLCVIAIFIFQATFVASRLKASGGPPQPEWHLLIAIPGAVAFSAGLFWFGWTGKSNTIPWIVPTLSGILTGFGLLATFIPSIAYVVEVRRDRAASATAAHTILRSFFGAAFPLFAPYMYSRLGVEWAMTLLGCLAALMIPVPVLLYIFGASLRNRTSKQAQESP